MIIIGAITTRASNKLRLWIPKLEIAESGDCSTARKRRSSTAISRLRE